MKLSLIIPCYNESENISLFMKECISIFKNSKEIEYIFVNDGSTDDTWNKISLLKNKYKGLRIIGLNFSRNFGKEAAMYAGIKQSQGDYVCFIDADLQQHPKYVKKMLDFVENNKGYDSVACYQDKRNEGFILSFFKNLFYKVINKLSDIDFYQNASDFRLINRKMADAIKNMEEYYRFSKGLFSYIGFNVYYMPYEVLERKNGKSSWSFIKLVKYAMNGIIGFSIAPLRLATIIGVISFILSVIYFIVVVIQKLTVGIAINGYPTIICLLLFFGGLQMIFIGFIGAYLGRNYIESKKRPIYIIKDTIK